MFISDITDLLATFSTGNVQQNVYFLNNALLHYKDDLYLMAFRRIQYKIPSGKGYHPWKIWDNGYKFLYEDPHRIERKKGYGRRKYRQRFSADAFRLFWDHHPEPDLIHVEEFDSTGIAFLSYNHREGWKVLKMRENLFGTDMNQDARLHKTDNDELYITYNAFFERQGTETVEMIRRRFTIHATEFIYFYEEEHMLNPNLLHIRPVEKNCVLHNQNVLYSIHNGNFRVQLRDRVENRYCQTFAPRDDAHVLFSIGCSPIPYRNRFLSCGHVKIEYRNGKKIPFVLQEFMSHINVDEIYWHGRYLYFLFFYEFDEYYQIHRVSHALYPTDGSCHVPYVVCFPSGLSYGVNSAEILLSYGEGDVRCKVLSLHIDELEDLLFPVHQHSMKFQFLNCQEYHKKPRLLHYGYFHEYNCGDDLFMLIFKGLQLKYAPHASCRFYNHYHDHQVDVHRDIVIFGGGDIITPYFLTPLSESHIPKHAIGVGVPFLVYFEQMKYFETIVLRNARDVDKVQSLVNIPVQHYPDLGFLFPLLYPDFIHSITTASVPTPALNIGISLTRTYFRPNANDSDYRDFVNSIVSMMETLLKRYHDKNIHIHLLPFCHNPWTFDENDCILNRHLKEFFTFDDRIHLVELPLTQLNPENYVPFTYHFVSQMDFMICSRFHAHIFCLSTQTPFISLSCSRKCQELMYGYHLHPFYYELQVNSYDRPIGIQHPDTLYSLLFHSIETRTDIKNLLTTLYTSSILPACHEFLHFWQSFLCRHHISSPPPSPPSLS